MSNNIVMYPRPPQILHSSHDLKSSFIHSNSSDSPSYQRRQQQQDCVTHDSHKLTFSFLFPNSMFVLRNSGIDERCSGRTTSCCESAPPSCKKFNSQLKENLLQMLHFGQEDCLLLYAVPKVCYSPKLDSNVKPTLFMLLKI